MKAVELFCGIGLSSLGIVRAGATLVGANDIQAKFIDGSSARRARRIFYQYGEQNQNA